MRQSSSESKRFVSRWLYVDGILILTLLLTTMVNLGAMKWVVRQLSRDFIGYGDSKCDRCVSIRLLS